MFEVPFGFHYHTNLQRRFRAPEGLQTSLAEDLVAEHEAITPGYLIAYCRRGGGYGPTTDGYVVRAESTDGGHTWSEGRDSQFPNPNAAVDFLKLSSDALLLVYNNSMTDRDPLTVALSADQDRSWPWRRDLVTGPHDYAYPVAIQSRDGKIHIVYTSEQRTVVNHAVIDEEWIKTGK